ncbi:homocysteine S-methyltransferase family protein [Actinoplanes sp. TFC3]|uniref:homocysteine S-methyltransferase family protein n=1 Tax=Actinoplanes sp. TFC3 TaxID=1710355 RepID=UPI000834CFE1|nr:homocysteine S-methyltransferase family protein [Actinoplanes sp. TFC3]
MDQTTTTRTTRLDGGTASGLEAAGITMTPPWWTTRALLSDEKRRVLRSLHEQFLAAGAQVITAGTFRTNLRTLQAAGLQDAGLAWMVHAAVGVAQAAQKAANRNARVVASMAPVADCYRPDLVPDDDSLRAEHHWLAVELSRAGVDTVLIETMNTTREARAALEQVQAAGMTGWVSFVCGDDARLLSGESLADAARAVVADGAAAVMVNCADPVRTQLCLPVLADVSVAPIGAYPNLEDRDGITGGWEPKAFAALMTGWCEDYGLTFAGGCCGTTPEHVAAMTAALGG